MILSFLISFSLIFFLSLIMSFLSFLISFIFSSSFGVISLLSSIFLKFVILILSLKAFCSFNIRSTVSFSCDISLIILVSCSPNNLLTCCLISFIRKSLSDIFSEDKSVSNFLLLFFIFNVLFSFTNSVIFCSKILFLLFKSLYFSSNFLISISPFVIFSFFNFDISSLNFLISSSYLSLVLFSSELKSFLFLEII